MCNYLFSVGRMIIGGYSVLNMYLITLFDMTWVKIISVCHLTVCLNWLKNKYQILEVGAFMLNTLKNFWELHNSLINKIKAEYLHGSYKHEIRNNHENEATHKASKYKHNRTHFNSYVASECIFLYRHLLSKLIWIIH